MGRAGVTANEIYNAAHIIAATGKIPTVQAVRNMIGSGSISTIHKHLLSWKKSQLIRPLTNVDYGAQVDQNLRLQRENANLKNKLNTLISEMQTIRKENLKLKERFGDGTQSSFKNFFMRCLTWI